MLSRFKFSALLLGLILLWAPRAYAVTPAPPAQFDVTGFIQEATLDTTGGICVPTDPKLAGGTMTVNGVKMIVPCNTILQMPATSLTWAELFDRAVSDPVPPGPSRQSAGQTGLALSDSPPPFPSFEVRAVGNILTDPVTGEQRYIVGLIAPIGQQGLNIGSGYINFIDYATGRFRVGGRAGDPTSGALVEVNDPVGRFGLAHSPDQRFTADTGNPTVRATTGYPVGVPVVAPPASDPDRPLTNRPLNGDTHFPTDPFLAIGAPLRKFDMPAPNTPGVSTDPTKQVPLMVGDWVDYSGTLCKLDHLGPTTPANTYISAHTLTARIGVFTAPGVPPAYVAVDVIQLGTGGAALPGIPQEATTRIKVEGFTSDPTRLIDIYALDINPCTGVATERLLGITDPGAQPVRGRFRFVLNGGLFAPPTRDMLVRSRTGVLRNVANGLDAGQYRLPDFTFIFPENFTLGDPIIPNNFQDLPFLAQGSGPLGGPGSGGPIVGQLDPWPGSPAPEKAACAIGGHAPLVNAGPDISVGSGVFVTLAGSVTFDPNSAGSQVSWEQTGGPGVALAGFNTLTPTFTAPVIAPGKPSSVLTFRLTVTDQFGSGSASVNITVVALPDVVAGTAALWRAKSSSIAVRSTSNSPSALLTVDMVKSSDGGVVHLGAMRPLKATKKGRSFTLVRTGAPKPASVTVRSSLGGVQTAPVTVR